MEASLAVSMGTRGCQNSYTTTMTKVFRKLDMDTVVSCKRGYSKSDDNFANANGSRRNYKDSDSTNPLTIPEIASHLLMFVDRSDLLTCRLTCGIWKVVGARELVRRSTFHFNEANLYRMDSFQSLMNSTAKTSIRLKISLTQFGFCRHHEQLCNILFMYGSRVTHFTLAFVEHELNVELDILRLKLNQNESVLRSATTNFTVPSPLVSLLHADTLGLLKVLNHFNFSGVAGHNVLMSYQKRMEPCLKNYFMELILMIPNLKSIKLYSYYGICCNYLLEVLAIASLGNLRHLTIESPSLIWDTLCRDLVRSTSSFDLNTLSLEHVSPFIRRMNLSSRVGNSRLIPAASLHLRLTSDGYRTNSNHYHDFTRLHILEKTISSYEQTNAEEGEDCETSYVNCIGLLGALDQSGEL